MHHCPLKKKGGGEKSLDRSGIPTIKRGGERERIEKKNMGGWGNKDLGYTQSDSKHDKGGFSPVCSPPPTFFFQCVFVDLSLSLFRASRPRNVSYLVQVRRNPI